MGEGVHVVSKWPEPAPRNTRRFKEFQRERNFQSKVKCVVFPGRTFHFSYHDTVSIKSLLSLLSSVGTYERNVLNNSNTKCFAELIKPKFT